MLVTIAIWYLLFRQPINPIPVIPAAQIPTYATAIYGADRPMGVAVSPSGDRIYVTQTSGTYDQPRLRRRRQPDRSMAPPASAGAEHVPVYVAIDPLTSEVYISDRRAGAIYIYDRDGVYQRTFALAQPRPGWQPLGLAFDQAGSLYVTDLSGPVQKVLVIDRTAQVVRTLGENDRLSFPNGIAVDPAGNVYVSDSNNGRLLVYGADGGDPRPGRSRLWRGQPGLAARPRARLVRPGLRRGHAPAMACSSIALPAATARAWTISATSAARALPTGCSSIPTASRSTRAVACTWPTRRTIACRSGATEAPGTAKREVTQDRCSPPIVAALDRKHPQSQKGGEDSEAMDTPACRGRALAVPCRDSCPGGWWTPRLIGEQRFCRPDRR